MFMAPPFNNEHTLKVQRGITLTLMSFSSCFHLRRLLNVNGWYDCQIDICQNRASFSRY